MPVGFDKVMICNMALAHVGAKTTIESIDESNAAAKQCKLWYDVARLQTLEAFDWGFARMSETLATHSIAAPESRWAFRYQLPADYVAARFMENPAGSSADAVPYRVEHAGDSTMCVLTNLGSAVLVYTYNTSSISIFTTQFVEALALALSVRIAYKLTGKRTLVASLGSAFKSAIVQAEVIDVNSSVPASEREAKTIRARS